MRYFLIFTLLLVLPLSLVAQQDDPAVTELLENFFRDNEGASESDAQLFLERLELLRQNPFDLNKVSREDLLSLQLLNELQVEQFLKYRESLGDFLNIYELQAVPGMELDDIRRILPFITVGTGSLDKRATSLLRGLTHGNNELLLRSSLSRPLALQDGVEGGPYAFAMRYRHNFDNRLRFGFTAENDPGEAFFNGSNKQGFDFYSAHLFINNTGGQRIKNFALGDYAARMGQGMLLQTGFSPGKNAESVSLLRGARKLNAYSAFGEAFFLRGAGATVRLSRQFELTLFGSYRKRDANTDTIANDIDDEVRFSSVVASGLHRTPNEIENEKTIREMLGGATLTWLHKAGQVSINALHLQYNHPFNPTEQPYRVYSFRGKQLTGFSVDHQYRWNNYLLFGENAMSDNGGFAALNGLLIGADRRVTLGLIHRYFEPEYQAVYAAPFAEVSGASNEQGFYTGIEIRPSKPWKINAYADVWRHPWLRFGIDGPSAGREYLIRVLWQPTRTFQTYAIFQSETKDRNAPSPETGLEENTRQRFRLHAAYKVASGVEFRSRVEWMFYGHGEEPASKGFLAYQEAVFKTVLFPVSGTFRYAVFDTEDYDTRVYSFENDLFSAVSIPGFAGRGNRFYMNLTWRLSKKFRVEGRYESTYLERAVTSGTKIGRESVYKLQMRVNF